MSTSVDVMMLTESYQSVRVEHFFHQSLIRIETVSKPDLRKGGISYNLRCCSGPNPQKSKLVITGER